MAEPSQARSPSAIHECAGGESFRDYLHLEQIMLFWLSKASPRVEENECPVRADAPHLKLPFALPDQSDCGSTCVQYCANYSVYFVLQHVVTRSCNTGRLCHQYLRYLFSCKGRQIRFYRRYIEPTDESQERTSRLAECEWHGHDPLKRPLAQPFGRSFWHRTRDVGGCWFTYCIHPMSFATGPLFKRVHDFMNGKPAGRQAYNYHKEAVYNHVRGSKHRHSRCRNGGR